MRLSPLCEGRGDFLCASLMKYPYVPQSVSDKYHSINSLTSKRAKRIRNDLEALTRKNS